MDPVHLRQDTRIGTTAAVTVATGTTTNTIALSTTVEADVHLINHSSNGKAAARNGSGLILEETGFSDKPAEDTNKVSEVILYRNLHCIKKLINYNNNSSNLGIVCWCRIVYYNVGRIYRS